ncbi:MAG: hypothetical protein ACR2ND_04775 [Solirubrobacteraceae bacterium]
MACAALVLALWVCASPAPTLASTTDPFCTSSYGAADSAKPAPFRFGIDPELAGSVGLAQTASKPENETLRLAALNALRPTGKELVLRVNRLFFSDGEAGIQHFQQLISQDTTAGFDVELQVRYHPTPAEDGNLSAWTAYVRHVVDVFGPNPRVVAMTITNENNINISPNTSDGSYKSANQALIDGVIAARQEADAHGWSRLKFGFTYAWRFLPTGDAAFWNALGAGGAAFRNALSFVGLDVYPGSFYPPVVAPPDDLRQEMVTAMATVRDCWMASAQLGAAVPIWITENGYPTTPVAHTEAEQAQSLAQMVDTVHAYAGAYGVSDYRWFNLRDNNSQGTGIFDNDGLLRDDYSPKPSFGELRARIAAFGQAAPAELAPPAPATPLPGATLPPSATRPAAHPKPRARCHPSRRHAKKHAKPRRPAHHAVNKPHRRHRPAHAKCRRAAHHRRAHKKHRTTQPHRDRA